MKVLVLEDSSTYRKIIKNYFSKNLVFIDFYFIASFEELKNLKQSYDLYIVDFVLPDSQDGRHIEYLLSKKKPIIVMSQYDTFKNSPYKNRIVEFIIKDKYALDYLVTFIKRYYKNQNLNAIIVDDSRMVRNYVKKILLSIGLNVDEAKDGSMALDKIKTSKPDLIITDLNMPKMDGEELIENIRSDYTRTELPIMMISDEKVDDKFLKALKLGANDYLKKPFLKEELILRVNNLLDIYDSFQSIKGKLQLDNLTGAFNRFFLETTLDNLFMIHETKSIVMLDIDHFKKINDTYGHQMGDEILKYFVATIKNNIRKTDYVVRYGGEEFLIFLPDATKEEAKKAVEKIKNSLTEYKGVKYTFSAGIADEGETLPEMIKIADKRLYKAKETGRNRIVID